MPSIGTISNGESGLSVRTKLNEVINVVNTGVTGIDYYVTGGTYNNGTGTLTLNRQNGSVNVTGFLTGVTETQNLTNVLAIGNTTSGRNIVVTDGDKIVGSNLTLSGGTSFNVDTQTGNVQGTIDIVPTGTTQSIRFKSFNVVNNNTGEMKMGTDTSTLRMTKSSDYTELFVTPVGGNGFYQDNTSSDFIGFVGLNDATYNSGIHSENPTTGEFSRISMTPTNMFKEVTDNTGYTYVDMYYNSFNVFSDDSVGNTGSLGVSTTSVVSVSTDGTNTSQVETTPSQTQIQSNDGVNTSTLDVLGNGNIIFTSTDGSFTNTSTIDPDRSLFEITSGTTNANIDLDANNGITISHNVGSYNPNIGIDGNTGVIQTSSTYGTRTDTLRLNPEGGVGNQTNFSVTDTGLSNGTGINLNPDQSYQWAGDYEYTMTAYTENYCSGVEQYLFQQYGDYISQLRLDPASLNTGTQFKSEDLVVGSSTILSLGYDGSGSFDMVDGTGNSSNFTYTPSNLIMGVTDGANTNNITLTSTNLNISNIPAFDDDSAAGTGGLVIGDLYQTTGLGASPLDVAGILMIKQ